MTRSDRPQLRQPTDFVHRPIVLRDAGNDIKLLPAQGKSREQLAAEAAGRSTTTLPLSEEEHQQIRRQVAQRQGRRFSLLELLAVPTFLAVMLSAARAMPLTVFSGVAGAICILTLLVVSLRPPRSRLGRLACATLIVSYLLATALSLFGLQ